MNTKAEVLKVLEGDGWSACYRQDETTFSWSPIVAFLVLRHTGGRIEVVGLVNDDVSIVKSERADRWPNFEGYTRA